MDSLTRNSIRLKKCPFLALLVALLRIYIRPGWNVKPTEKLCGTAQ